MKPLPRDHRHRLLIQGSELKALQSLTWEMAEAFGLDRKIENYKGSRPLTLYRWDLECLLDVIDHVLGREPDGRLFRKADVPALKSLAVRLHQEYETVYGHEETQAPIGEKPKGRGTKGGKSAASTGTVYQFKITLRGTDPPIWRRIQVRDCTLDQLHEHIQAAMGWTNSHLHQFEIGKQYYGDPMLMEEDFDERGFKDSTTTRLRDVVPENRKRFRFLYEYDFGDGWEHEVLFERRPAADPEAEYPLCTEGAGACPPEDIGGTWGYADLLEAVANKDHERHKEFLDWVGEGFDPEKFDPAEATAAMREVKLNWSEDS